MKFYRGVVNGVGIYEAVDRDCPRDDDRRIGKPDGGWLAKVGMNYPGATSYWTELGWKKYQDSGLYDWHKSVVLGEVQVIEIDQEPENILYQDEYQIIVNE